MTQQSPTAVAYSVGTDSDQRFDFPARVRSLYGRRWELVVTDLAEDYFGNHDGWEASWPLEFRIYENDAEVARFYVEMEALPHFSATELESREAAK